MTAARLAGPRTISDRDFLIGSVWEGSGDELHTNREAARETMFGARVLSGISGMLLAIDQFDPTLLWRPISELEWSFDSPLYEGDALSVRGSRTGELVEVVASVQNRRTQGSLVLADPRPAREVVGQQTRGRTMTTADVDLFASWLGRGRGTRSPAMPWPIVVLTASGLVTRGRHLGEHTMTLNRWFHWSFVEDVPLDETLHCVLESGAPRRSRKHPDFTVAEHSMAVVSSSSGRQYAHFRWVVMYR